MKKLTLQATIGLLVSGAVLSAVAGGPDVAPASLTSGLYLGMGGSYNTIDNGQRYNIRRVDNTVFANGAVTTDAVDAFTQSNSRFAPMAQIGYWAPIDEQWLWGLQATYKYLQYTTDEHALTNATTASAANAGGAAVFSNVLTGAAKSYVMVNNELLLLAYAGMQFTKSYAYLGLGAVMFTVSSHVGSDVATVTSPLIGNTGRFYTNYFNFNKTVWGGAAQVGYNYYFDPTWFLGMNYTYAISSEVTSGVPSTQTNYRGGPSTTLAASPNVPMVVTSKQRVLAQEVVFSVNKVFAM